MAIALLEIIGTDQALFENDSEPTQTLGDITFTYTLLGGTTYSVDFEGNDVEGTTIDLTNAEGEIKGTVNPTKVFWLIANVMKEVLCPDCV